jgi:hypothetical protein
MAILDFREASFYFRLRKGFLTFCALVKFFFDPVINELVGEINAVKPEAEGIHELKMPVPAFIAFEIVTNRFHVPGTPENAANSP